MPSATRLIVQPLWEWVSRYAFLGVTTALLMGVVANWLLWQLGLPYLFWHEHWPRRFFSGIGVGMFTVNAGVVGFLLASRQKWIKDLETLWPGWQLNDPVLRFVVRYLTLTSAVLVAAVWVFAFRAPDYLGCMARFSLPASVTLGAALAALGLWRTRAWTESHVHRQTWLGRLLANLDQGAGQAQIPAKEIHRAAAVFFVAQMLFFVACGLAALTEARHLMSAGLVTAMFFSALISGYGAVRWWAEDYRFLWFIGIIGAWVVLAAWGQNRHTLLALRDEYEHPVPVTVRPPPNARLLDSGETVGAWGAQGGRRPLVVVAVNGGGIRSATWAVSMLTALERDIPGFPYHVRVITGASGGMVGAAYYVATLQKPAPGAAFHEAEGVALSPDAMIDAISDDALEATVRRLVFRDVWPVVWQAYADRGYALEREWEDNTKSMQQPLDALAAGEAEGWRPSLIFSPMMVEDGRRLLVSNLDLGAITETSASLTALELAKLVPKALDLHVSTVARMSASFPYVSPAAEVPTRPLRRVVDAGYYDNHGVALAASWILANEPAIRQHASKVVLVQIPDQRVDPKRFPSPCARAWWARGLSDLTSPPEGILAGWTAAMSFRNDEAVDSLARVLNSGGDDDFFRSFVFEPYDPVPPPDLLQVHSDKWDELAEAYCDAVDEEKPVALSWHMIPRDRERLRKSPTTEKRNCPMRAALVEWWTGAPPPTLWGCDRPVVEPPPMAAAP